MLLRCTLLSLPVLNTDDGTNAVPEGHFVKIRDLMRDHALAVAKEVKTQNGKSEVGTCHYWLGRAEMGLGEFEAAKETVQEVLRLGGEDELDEERREEVEGWMAEWKGKGKSRMVA
jgi:hypothetical protein